jgi:hypothetical protein
VFGVGGGILLVLSFTRARGLGAARASLQGFAGGAAAGLGGAVLLQQFCMVPLTPASAAGIPVVVGTAGAVGASLARRGGRGGLGASLGPELETGRADRPAAPAANRPRSPSTPTANRLEPATERPPVAVPVPLEAAERAVAARPPPRPRRSLRLRPRPPAGPSCHRSHRRTLTTKWRARTAGRRTRPKAASARTAGLDSARELGNRRLPIGRCRPDGGESFGPPDRLRRRSCRRPVDAGRTVGLAR